MTGEMMRMDINYVSRSRERFLSLVAWRVTIPCADYGAIVTVLHSDEAFRGPDQYLLDST